MSNKSINKGVNQYLDFLIDLCFQGKNRLFYHGGRKKAHRMLSFKIRNKRL